MYAITAFIAFSCLATSSAGRRNNANHEAQLGLGSEVDLSAEKLRAASVDVLFYYLSSAGERFAELQRPQWANTS